MSDYPTSGSDELAKLLAVMNGKGGFPISVITDMHGFPISSAAVTGQDPERQSAVVAMVQKMASQVRDQLGMAMTDEISMFDTKGQRLVCRPFIANGHEMILAVLVPDRHQTYRRLTNKMVTAIGRLWRL